MFQLKISQRLGQSRTHSLISKVCTELYGIICLGTQYKNRIDRVCVSLLDYIM